MPKMYTEKNQQKLRRGYTTGSCAAMAAKAAAELLLGGDACPNVRIVTPAGVEIEAEVIDCRLEGNCAYCSIIKDSGDDPDVTDGIKITVCISKTDTGIEIDGGKGIGKVTRKGLGIDVGKAAINPAPKSQIRAVLTEIKEKYGYNGGFMVLISAENGEEISKKTFNERLGIVGGISILGSSGIVEPMSEKALIDTIKVDIDVKYEKNNEIILICPGNYGRDFAFEKYGIDLQEAVKCSNYIGETLDYCVYKGFKKILLIGHGGKLIKLAAGVMDTHSKTADCRNEIFAAHCGICGMEKEVIRKVMSAVTVDECLDIIDKDGSKYNEILCSIGDRISFYINKRIGNKTKAEYVIFTLEKGEIIKSENADNFINELKE